MVLKTVGPSVGSDDHSRGSSDDAHNVSKLSTLDELTPLFLAWYSAEMAYMNASPLSGSEDPFKASIGMQPLTGSCGEARRAASHLLAMPCALRGWTHDPRQSTSSSSMKFHDSRIDKSALDKIEHKDRILRFLLDVHARKRPHRKRTEALLSLLLEVDSWQKAFAEDQDLEAAIAQFRRAEEGNQAQELTAEEEEEAQEDLRSLSTLWRDDVEEKLAAAAARGSIGVLLVRVVAAYNLINADWFSLSDPYVKVKVGRQKQTTAVVDDCLEAWL
ncbi:Nedd4l [Symbiodinium natans]|uniref:Nedd4l protein n=1 Tax=Symbiodinium natans TaxID=878477 RepID=A0A812SV76_9DINO|nr:Nedd4l [Symbiodinium natans]